MEKNKKFRFDILITISIPLILTFIYLLQVEELPQTINLQELIISIVLIIFALILETVFLKEHITKKSLDNGIVSGFIISAVISFLLLNSIYFKLLLFDVTSQTLFIIGSSAFLIGIICRFYAKAILGQYFSHSIRILKEHELITSGIYKFIRHPAYTGTLLLIIGSCLMFKSFLGIILLLIVIPLVLIRIKHEEKVLIQKFSTEYIEYQSNTKKLIPFVF